MHRAHTSAGPIFSVHAIVMLLGRVNDFGGSAQAAQKFGSVNHVRID